MFENLFIQYKILKSYVLDKKIHIGSKGTCRYCGKVVGNTKFSKVAHSLPELIGNKFLFSMDECDECNEYFDKNLENNLANFLGVSRTICQVRGKKGIPKYKSKSGERIEVIGRDLLIIENHDSSLIDVNKDTETVSIQAEYKTYVPVQVYKCFVKMAISIFPEKELSTYRQCIKWVRFNQKPHNFNDKLLKMHVFFIPGNIEGPIMIALNKRIGDKKKYPNLTCFIRFDNYIFYFVIPSFSKEDKYLDVNSLNFIVPSNIDLTSEKPNKVENIAHMKYEGGWNKQIPLDEIPKKILDRIHELGLKFKQE